MPLIVHSQGEVKRDRCLDSATSAPAHITPSAGRSRRRCFHTGRSRAMKPNAGPLWVTYLKPPVSRGFDQKALARAKLPNTAYYRRFGKTNCTCPYFPWEPCAIWSKPPVRLYNQARLRNQSPGNGGLRLQRGISRCGPVGWFVCPSIALPRHYENFCSTFGWQQWKAKTIILKLNLPIDQSGNLVWNAGNIWLLCEIPQAAWKLSAAPWLMVAFGTSAFSTHGPLPDFGCHQHRFVWICFNLHYYYFFFQRNRPEEPAKHKDSGRFHYFSVDSEAIMSPRKPFVEWSFAFAFRVKVHRFVPAILRIGDFECGGGCKCDRIRATSEERW